VCPQGNPRLFLGLEETSNSALVLDGELMPGAGSGSLGLTSNHKRVPKVSP
jgi:hypothetical protein